MGTKKTYYCNLCKSECNSIDLYPIWFNKDNKHNSFYESVGDDIDKVEYHLCGDCIHSATVIFDKYNTPIDNMEN